jgi:tetratricopeptide (TPR) repeat protein
VSIPAPVPCARCGRAIAPTVTEAAALPICAQCTRDTLGGGSLLVRTFGGSVTVDTASLLERLRSGQLRGSDWIEGEDGEAVPIAAHPAIAPLYARGEIPEPPVAVAPPPAPRPRPVRHRKPLPIGKIVRVLSGVAIAGGLAAAAFLFAPKIPGWAKRTGEVIVADNAPSPSTPAETTPPAVVPGKPPPDLLAAVARAIGPVEEPVALLEAQAIAAWSSGGPKGRAEALALARRAVARSTTDPRAAALLAVLAAQVGGEPGLVLLAGQVAATGGAGGPASQLGRAALALGERDPKAAAAAVAECGAGGDLVCRLVAASALEQVPGGASAAIAAWDQLVTDWPEHRDPPRVAALLAALHDDPSAEARLGALSATDPAVLGARGLLEWRNGNLDRVVALAEQLGPEAPRELSIAAARVCVSRGEPARALALVEPLDVEKAPRTPTATDVRLVIAQARWLVARDDAAALPAARTAIERLLEMGRGDAAVAQVRALVAHKAGDSAEEGRAWAGMDETSRTGPELARVYKTQLALLNDAKMPGSELLVIAEKARVADPSDPNVHVWAVEVDLIGHNHLVAIASLRRAVAQVDGQLARRRTDLVTLETGAPAKALRAHLEEALGNEGRFAAQLPLARATCSWLAGDQKAARTALASAPNLETDADALALRGRLYEAAGEAGRAVRDWDQVAAQRPKQPEFLLAALRAHVLARELGTATKLAELVRASRVNPALAPAMLAEVQLAAGDRPGAIKLLNEALAADPLDLAARARLRELQKGG